MQRLGVHTSTALLALVFAPPWAMPVGTAEPVSDSAMRDASLRLPLEQRTANPYADTYQGVHGFDQAMEHWGAFNVHDPALLFDGEYTYMVSTDVAWGAQIEKAGIQVRRSKNLVDWEFRGWASDGLPKEALAHINANGGQAFEGVWAPYLCQVGDTYRLYYSLSSRVPKNSVIGLLTGPTPEGPWAEAGLVVWSRNDIPGTNAIDPTVIVTPEGEHWFYYGSAWDGIYALRLDPGTGLALNEGDRGIRVAQRGSTSGMINGNIEAPEIIYHPGFDQYYLFLAYDWLHTKYNVRVYRSDRPEGPFLDAAGKPVNTNEDQGPMILAPYRFENHPGWQGVSHCGVGQGDGRWYLASQGRPANSDYSMVLHLRELYWTRDGWPVVAPQRYAGESGSPVLAEDLVGSWELIDFDYEAVPGFAEEQTDPGFSESTRITLKEDGAVTGGAWTQWHFANGRLFLGASGQPRRFELVVDRAWDWECHTSTIVFTGLGPDDYPLWGKRRGDH